MDLPFILTGIAKWVNLKSPQPSETSPESYIYFWRLERWMKRVN
jgi:hypothetical protein